MRSGGAVCSIIVDEESAEGIDLPPGADYDDDGEDQSNRRRLLEMAREAEALQGEQDEKLQKAIALVKCLIKDGFQPIVFCRFIPTAEYVAEALRKALPKGVEVAAVTGLLPPDEREARVERIGPGRAACAGGDRLLERRH